MNQHNLLLLSLQSLFFCFIVISNASPIINAQQDILIYGLSIAPPTKTYHQQAKRDVAELHNTGNNNNSTNNQDWSNGGSSTTTTVVVGPTGTSKPSKPTPTSLPSTNPADIYGGVGITPQNGVAGAFLIVLGLYLMVFGFRSFRITLGVCGFLTFGLITWVAMANNQPYYGYINNDITILAVPGGLGILGAIIYALFWNISIYLVGALGGFTLAMYIMCCRSDLLITSVVARAAFLVALPFFMSFVTFFAERYVLLFTFAFAGSYCFIVGIEFLAHTGYLAGIKTILDGNPYHQVVYGITRNVIVLIVFIPIIFVISFGWQFMYNKGQKFGVIFVEEVRVPEKGGDKSGSEEHHSSHHHHSEAGSIHEEPHINNITINS